MGSPVGQPCCRLTTFPSIFLGSHHLTKKLMYFIKNHLLKNWAYCCATITEMVCVGLTMLKDVKYLTSSFGVINMDLYVHLKIFNFNI